METESIHTVREALDKYRKKLLDLSARNNLLNFNNSNKSCLRIIDELPDSLFNSLFNENKILKFIPVPEPELNDYIDETPIDDNGNKIAVPEGETNPYLRKPTVLEYAKKMEMAVNYEVPDNKDIDESKHSDLNIQTLMFPDELEKRLSKISSNTRLFIEETGINTLYIAFGFLEWFDIENPEKPYLAPLMLLPVTIAKSKKIDKATGTYFYSLSFNDEDLFPNLSLKEKLDSMGVELPDFEEEETPESYFNKCRDILEGKSKWSIKRYITLGNFSFGRIILYQDLNPEIWEDKGLLENPIVNKLIFGNSEERKSGNGVYNLDDIPTEELPLLIADADSSQMSAVIDFLKGENLAISGPPGTGKSQTITNMIGAALNAGKTVLFMAEKMAALEVVYRRLEHAGLADFCLELHSHKTSKKAVLDSINQRLLRQGTYTYSDRSYNTNLKIYDEKKNLINGYLKLLNTAFGALDRKIYEIFYISDYYKQVTSVYWQKINNINVQDIEKIDESGFTALNHTIDDYIKHFETVSKGDEPIEKLFWYGFWKDSINIALQEEISYEITKAAEVINELEKLFNEIINFVGSDVSASFSELYKLLDFKKNIPLNDNCRLSMLPKMKKKDNFDLFNSYIDLAKDKQDCEETLKLHENYISFLNSKSYNELNELKEKISQIKLDSDTITKLSNTYEASNELIPAAGHFKYIMKILADSTSFSDQISIHNLDEVLEFLKIIIKTDPAALPYRNDEFFSSDSDAKAAALIKSYEDISSLHSGLNKKIDMKKLPSLSELEKMLFTVINTNFITKFFSSDFKKAADFFKGISKSVPITGQNAVKETLEESIKYSKHLEAFNENRDYKKLLGKNFNGIDTDIELFENAYNMYKLLNENKIGAKIADTRQFLHSAQEQDFKKLSMLAAPYANSIDELINVNKTHLFVNKPFYEYLNRRKITDPGKILDSAEDLNYVYSDLKSLAENVEGIREDLTANAAVNAVISIKNSIKDAESKIAELTEHYIAVEKKLTESLDMKAEWHKYTKDEIISTFTLAKYIHEYNPDFLHPDLSNIMRMISGLESVCTDKFQSHADRIVEAGKVDWAAWTHRVNEKSFKVFSEFLAKAVENIGGLHNWSSFMRSRNDLCRYNLESLLALVESKELPPNQLHDLFASVFYWNYAKKILNTYEELSTIDAITLETAVKHFCKSDVDIISENDKVIASKLASKPVPDGINYGKKSEFTDLSLLEHEISKQKRHIPIRKLIKKAGKAIQALKPCFMMSPHSVAQFAEIGDIEWDVCIIDEASQVKPEYAVGAVSRAKQIIVVGDGQQLPPTSFFERINNVDEEEADEQYAYEDAESILNLAENVFKPSRRLLWHYRSRHENLIAFSNHEFYDDQLYVYPSPSNDFAELGINYHYLPDAVYSASKNETEAAAVIDAVFKEMERKPNRSIGVVALNITQRGILEDIYERKLKDEKYKKIDHEFHSNENNQDEPFFIKNLENVQGDERDTIFISMTYGKNKTGRILNQFGPINGAYGHRRLNVLFTRAKRKIELFTSMEAEDINITSTSSNGAKILKAYLSYAKDKTMADTSNINLKPTSKFEIAVGNALKNLGYDIRYQIGVAGFRMDVAVVNPYKKSDYLCGIECDGSAYNSSKTTRDRDRIRHSVLKGMGWKIFRIWSTDWFYNSAQQLNVIKQELDTLIEAEKLKAELIKPEEKVVEIQKKQYESEQLNEKTSPLFLNMNEARKKLEELRENVLKKESENFDEEKSILSDELINIYLEKLPIDNEDWLKCVPYETRKNIDIVQFKYKKEIFKILEDTNI